MTHSPLTASPGIRLDVADVSPTRDVTTYVTVYMVLLFAITAYQRIGPLGAIGQPSVLVAAGIAALWLTSRLSPSIQGHHGVQPVRVALWVYTWYLAATLVAAQTRRLTSLEQSGSARELILIVAMVGLSLAIMDGVPTMDRLNTLLRRLTWAGSWLAAVGVGQFITGSSLTIRIPGLAFVKGNFVGNRSSFNRPSGTAQHPIEFSVILSALLPLALHYAFESESGSRQQKFAIAGVTLIALGIPLSISRTGIISVLVALAVVSLGWTWRRRLQAGLVALASIPVLWVTIPGLVGTFRGMFTSTDSDPSIQARIDRIPRVMELIREYPLFGRGVGTFSPEDYLLLDNDIFVTTIEIGIVGLVLTLATFVFVMVVSTSTRHHERATPASSHLGYALAAGIAAIVISFATFDAMFFTQLRGVLFILIGAVGALWRLTREGPGFAVPDWLQRLSEDGRWRWRPAPRGRSRAHGARVDEPFGRHLMYERTG